MSCEKKPCAFTFLFFEDRDWPNVVKSAEGEFEDLKLDETPIPNTKTTGANFSELPVYIKGWIYSRYRDNPGALYKMGRCEAGCLCVLGRRPEKRVLDQKEIFTFEFDRVITKTTAVNVGRDSEEESLRKVRQNGFVKNGKRISYDAEIHELKFEPNCCPSIAQMVIVTTKHSMKLKLKIELTFVELIGECIPFEISDREQREAPYFASYTKEDLEVSF